MHNTRSMSHAVCHDWAAHTDTRPFCVRLVRPSIEHGLCLYRVSSSGALASNTHTQQQHSTRVWPGTSCARARLGPGPPPLPLSVVGSRRARAPVASAHTAPARSLAPGPSPVASRRLGSLGDALGRDAGHPPVYVAWDAKARGLWDGSGTPARV